MNIGNIICLYIVFLLVEIKTFGRKNSMIMSSAASVVLSSLYIVDSKWWQVIVTVSLLYFGDMILKISQVFIAEVLETEVRVFGLGVCNVVARFLGGIGIYIFYYIFSFY